MPVSNFWLIYIFMAGSLNMILQSIVLVKLGLGGGRMAYLVAK